MGGEERGVSSRPQYNNICKHIELQYRGYLRIYLSLYSGPYSNPFIEKMIFMKYTQDKLTVPFKGSFT
jgi:hypothetical protein